MDLDKPLHVNLNRENKAKLLTISGKLDRSVGDTVNLLLGAIEEAEIIQTVTVKIRSSESDAGGKPKTVVARRISHWRVQL